MKRGACVTAKDEDGDTALDVARRRDEHEVLTILESAQAVADKAQALISALTPHFVLPPDAAAALLAVGVSSVATIARLEPAEIRAHSGLGLLPAKRLKAAAEVSAEMPIRAELDPDLQAHLTLQALVLEAGPVLIKEGVDTLADLAELSVEDLKSVGISSASAQKLKIAPAPTFVAAQETRRTWKAGITEARGEVTASSDPRSAHQSLDGIAAEFEAFRAGTTSTSGPTASSSALNWGKLRYSPRRSSAPTVATATATSSHRTAFRTLDEIAAEFEATRTNGAVSPRGSSSPRRSSAPAIFDRRLA